MVGVLAVVVAAIGGALALGATGRAGAVRPPTPRFVDDSASAGLDHRYEGGFEHYVGGGVASFDCDDDGLPDLYLAGGSTPAALYRNASGVGGRLRFARVASAATDLTDVTGAYPIDIDGDGNIDLAVLRVGEDVVLRGRGDCRFERANEMWGIDGGDGWTVAFSATWEDERSLPTLAFGSYLAPDHRSCADSRLLRAAADGNGYAAPIALHPGYCTLSILFSDWQHRGRRDLRMTNDRHYYRDGSDQLWRVTPGASPVPYGDADGWRPLQIWGMGIASQDVTGDGVPEVFLTSQGDNKLQTLVPHADGPRYEDIALPHGVTATRPFAGGDVLPSTAWHAEFQDVNNDGFVDLLVTKGNVEAQPDYAKRDPNDLLLGTAEGTFVESADRAGIVDYRPSRGAAVVDLNDDGLLDLVVVHRHAEVSVWRNTSGSDAGHWIEVRPRQPGEPNVDAIGAWIDVRIGDRTLTRERTVGGGHASGELGSLHFGLGDATEARVRVEWPDGKTGPWQTVRAGARVTIDR